VEGRLDEARARVKVGALRGAGWKRVSGVESDGSGHRGFRLAAARLFGTRLAKGVVRRPMESSGWQRQERYGRTGRVNVKRAMVTER
jgi:hypothetical protein